MERNNTKNVVTSDHCLVNRLAGDLFLIFTLRWVTQNWQNLVGNKDGGFCHWQIPKLFPLLRENAVTWKVIGNKEIYFEEERTWQITLISIYTKLAGPAPRWGLLGISLSQRDHSPSLKTKYMWILQMHIDELSLILPAILLWFAGRLDLWM